MFAKYNINGNLALKSYNQAPNLHLIVGAREQTRSLLETIANQMFGFLNVSSRADEYSSVLDEAKLEAKTPKERLFAAFAGFLGSFALFYFSFFAF